MKKRLVKFAAVAVVLVAVISAAVYKMKHVRK